MRRAACGLSHLYRTLGGSLRTSIDCDDERDKNERHKDLQAFHLSSFFLGFEDPDSEIIDLVLGIAAGPARLFLRGPASAG